MISTSGFGKHLSFSPVTVPQSFHGSWTVEAQVHESPWDIRCRFHEVALCGHSRITRLINVSLSNCRLLLLWRGTWSKGFVPDFTTIDPYWSLVSCWPFAKVYRISSTEFGTRLGLNSWVSQLNFLEVQSIETQLRPAFSLHPQWACCFSWNMEILLEDGGNLFNFSKSCCRGSHWVVAQKMQGAKASRVSNGYFGSRWLSSQHLGKDSRDLVTSTFTQQLHPHLNWTGTGSWEPTGSWHWEHLRISSWWPLINDDHLYLEWSGRNHSLMESPWQGATLRVCCNSVPLPIASPIRLLRLQENVRSNFLQRTWYPKQSWQTARVKAQSGDSLPKSPKGRNLFRASTRNSGSNDEHSKFTPMKCFP